MGKMGLQIWGAGGESPNRPMLVVGQGAKREIHLILDNYENRFKKHPGFTAVVQPAGSGGFDRDQSRRRQRGKSQFVHQVRRQSLGHGH
jgi:hypothetical protein